MRAGDGELIGYCCLIRVETAERVELLHAFRPRWWGKGLPTEAARACLRFAFEEADLAGVMDGVDTPNTASLRVIEKLGMVPVGEISPEAPGVAYFELAREDFRASEAVNRR